MPGPRDYTRSTIFSLATLGEGKCYWPNPPCSMPVTVVINGEPVTNLQVAHIRAANPNGPRFDPRMSDGERRSWKNLILLCTPHHSMIDKLKPNDYPIEVLEKWKSDRETGGLARLKGLSDLTEDRLQDMLAHSMKEAHKEIRSMLAEHKPIDPDAAMLLSQAARHLNMQTAEMMYMASSRLAPALSEYTQPLYQAATMLNRVFSEGTIHREVATLHTLIEELDRRIWQLRSLLGDR